MPDHPFPLRTTAQATGELGVAIVATLVRENLGWEFRRTPQESDFGIDGYIDIVTHQAYVTGKSLAVQIKTGTSFFAEPTPEGWRYRGELKHVNYYCNAPVPVVLILVDPTRRQAWWRQFEVYETDRTGGSWTLLVPRVNELGSGARFAMEKIAGCSTNYLPHLEQFWMLGENVREYDMVCIQVQRLEIETRNVRPFAKLFERLSVSREVVERAMNKVDFVVDGYNDDQRELYQVPEVVRWIERAIEEVKYLSYFLCLGDRAQGILLIISCLAGAERVDECPSQTPAGCYHVRFTSPDRISGFVTQQFEWLNEFTERHGLPEETNRTVSLRFSNRVSMLVSRED